MAYTKKPCPGCGEVHPYRSANSVCTPCAEKLKNYDKLDALIKAEHGKQTDIYFVPDDDWPWIPMKGCNFDGRRDFGKLLSRLVKAAGKKLSTGDGQSSTSYCYFKGVERESIPKRTSCDEHVWRSHVSLPKRFAVIVQELHDALCRAFKAEYAAGVSDGKNLLLGLQTGEVSLEDFWEKEKEIKKTLRRLDR
jgi:hypothetical protein